MTRPPRVELRCSPDVRRPVAAVLGLADLEVVAGAPPDLGLLVDTTGQGPSAGDPWLVASLPHLAVTTTGGRVRLGPFVEPGATACLRCLAVATAEEQRLLPSDLAAGATRLPRPEPDRAPDGPGSASLLLVAAGLAAREIRAWTDGRVPATWSATVSLDRDLTTHRRTWLRHPHCGCGWGEAVAGC